MQAPARGQIMGARVRRSRCWGPMHLQPQLVATCCVQARAQVVRTSLCLSLLRQACVFPAWFAFMVQCSVRCQGQPGMLDGRALCSRVWAELLIWMLLIVCGPCGWTAIRRLRCSSGGNMPRSSRYARLHTSEGWEQTEGKPCGLPGGTPAARPHRGGPCSGGAKHSMRDERLSTG